MLTRRLFMPALGAAASLAAMSRAFAGVTSAPLALRDAARAAWLYTFPLLESARYHARDVRRPEDANHLQHIPFLLNARIRQVTTPNDDTLYARGWLDLSGGPVRLTLPPSAGRYFCVALRDMYTNNFCVLGSRTTGDRGGDFTVIGPDAPPTPGAIRAPQNLVWVSSRVLVNGEADLAEGRKVLAGIEAAGPAGRETPPAAPEDAPWQDLFASAQRWIDVAPPPVTDGALFERIDALGLGPGKRFDARRFSSREGDEIAAGIAEARALIRSGQKSDAALGGWTYPVAGLGDYGQDYLTRAAVALGGLGALPRVEAMYMRAIAPGGGALFDGDGAYRLRFAPGAEPPADAFWSVSMYEATPDGRFYFTDNALNRYSIGDRTPGLARDADGGLTLWIGRADPGPERRGNWLPAPAKGPYSLVLRAYLPRRPLLEGAYRLPPVMPA